MENWREFKKCLGKSKTFDQQKNNFSPGRVVQMAKCPYTSCWHPDVDGIKKSGSQQM